MDNDETEDSIEKIGLDRKTVFGNKKNPYHTDLMKAIIVNIRNGSGESVKKSQNVLIAMLEELVSKKDAAEKKRILANEYGMIMTAELERRIQIMCNWSESIRERERTDVRIDIIERMIKANATKEQIISYGFTRMNIQKRKALCMQICRYKYHICVWMKERQKLGLLTYMQMGSIMLEQQLRLKSIFIKLPLIRGNREIVVKHIAKYS